MNKPNADHIEELDGIRGIAILLVLIGHAFSRLTWFAVLGVSLFFVLSGFLITGILLKSVGRHNYFGNFYARRALRIWPLYYLFLAVAYLTPAFSFSHADFPAWHLILYIQNFWPTENAPTILHTWSLAIEEQFYLAWPLLIWLCRTPRKAGWMALILIGISPAIRVIYHLHGHDPYALTFCRLDGLATGAGIAALALLCDSKRASRLILACLIISVLLLSLSHYTLLRKAFKDTSINLVFGCVVAAAFYWRGAYLTGILRNVSLRYLAKISYCAYLVHERIYALDIPVVFRFLITIAVSTASWYLFESQILKLKDRLTADSSARSIAPQPQSQTQSACLPNTAL